MAGDGLNWKENYPDAEGALFKEVRSKLETKVKNINKTQLTNLFSDVHQHLQSHMGEYFNKPVRTMYRPGVGVGVFVVKPDGSFIMIRRKGSHGDGSWGLPGGHLEYAETWEECARREVKEEIGIEFTKPISHIATTNDIFKDEGKHFITVFVKTPFTGGQPRICEPDKSTEMGWFTIETMPSNVFLPLKNLLKQEIDKTLFIEKA